MNHDHLEHLAPILDEAAAPTLERIRADCKRASSKRVRKMLQHIETHLFAQVLNVSTMKQACGIRDNSVVIHFHKQIGNSPKQYISERRGEVAARLLEETRLTVWKIGELVGYSNLGVFSKAFARWAGKRPMAYRKEHQRKSGQETDRSNVLARALAGRLTQTEAGALLRRLRELYPGANPPLDGGDSLPRDAAQRSA